ncbi:SpoIIE family protein phosphatase [Streptomyces sp. ISL-43]|uniref:SpoIIE family protein phosphatase n=1 Tax=Streptomyces sp. ISL-43 TaxID=2819183 RepID=UPI001BEB5967|nr:SpoIIE family protein phosphatase [Streptomyces sp. ISL-43]MBT2448650.1 SpoIIE family protein phosphatase [Streptomyces sp. ISL-43]
MTTPDTGASGPPRPGPGHGPGDNALAEAVTALTAEVGAMQHDRARRRLLDLATGVLTVQLATTPAEAADHLLRLAVSTGLGAVDLAADIVNAAVGAVVVAAPEGQVPTASHARRARRSTAAALAADSAGEAVDTLLEGGLRPLGVRSVFLWRLTESGCLALVGQAGASRQEAVHWQWVPPEAGGTLHEAMAGGTPVWLPEGTPAGRPRLPGAAADGARALMPVRDQGRVAGLLLATWDGPDPLEEPLRGALVELCEPAARVLDWDAEEPGGPRIVAGLLDLLQQPAAVVLGAEQEPAKGLEVVEYVNSAARRALGAVRDPVGRPVAQVFPYAHEGLVRMLSAAATGAGPRYEQSLPVRGPQSPLSAPGSMAHVQVLPLGRSRSAVLWDCADDSPVLARVLGRLEQLASFDDDLLTGRSLWSEKAYSIFGMDHTQEPVPLRLLAARLHPDDTGALRDLMSALTERHEGAHALVRVVREDGGVRHVRIAAEPVLNAGVLTGLAGVYQDVSAQYRTEMALTASFDRLNAAHAEAELRNQVVRQLQEAIVPEAPALEATPGLRIAARYRPAAQEYRVGGDWYDVQPLPSGRVLLTVGDIAGHGIDAANGMVALRNALRGLAFTGCTPGRLMECLNEVALHTSGQPTATALCGLYDPADHTLCWTGAGHPPPLLLRDGRALFLESPHNILLGALPGARYEEKVTRLRPGDTLLLYTDGLIERRHSGLDESLAVLRGAAQRLAAAEPDEQAERLMAEVSGDTDDDTSLVVVRVAGREP